MIDHLNRGRKKNFFIRLISIHGKDSTSQEHKRNVHTHTQKSTDSFTVNVGRLKAYP